MRNKRFKSSILEDYIIISSASNFCGLNLCNLSLNESQRREVKSTYDFAHFLMSAYKKIMFKLGLIDLSLAILDKEMLTIFCDLNGFKLTEKDKILSKLNEFNENLQKIGKNLQIKLKKMELNNFELNYLSLDKLSQFVS